MSNFSPVKHLTSVVRQIQNIEVREFFKDVLDSDSAIREWFDADSSHKPNLLNSSAGRASLKLACTIKSQDSMIAILVRLFLFYVILGNGRLNSNQQGNTVYYGIPTTHHQMERRFQPQISLWFQENSKDIESDYPPVEGEISFRIMTKSAEEINNADIEKWAREIKRVFGEPKYIWRKGKEMVSYTVWNQGYQFQMLCRTKNDGEKLAKAILEIQNHQYRSAALNHNVNDNPSEAFPTIPPTETRRGKRKRLPRKRPIADVKFCHAILHLYGEPNPIVLVDYTGRYPNPIVT